jgi:hypothetical protein
VVADFVRQDIRLREVARRPEATPQLLVEAQIDVDLAIAGTVERTARGFSESAG